MTANPALPEGSLPVLLVVEDEKNTREGLRRWLEGKFDVYLAADADAALNVLESQRVDVLLTDLKLSGAVDGMELLARSRDLPHPPVAVMMTAYGSTDIAVEAMKRGATDYLTKPLNLDELEIILLKAWRSSQVEQENRQLRQELDRKYGLDRLIGSSPAMVRVAELVQQVASSPATVLIEGESGTGKELVAQALHQLSGRKNNPFVVVHCAALSPQLLESELFGHEKGAFTGAHTRRIGRFEQASHGTIFLDEIGEIDPSTQVKLLRVLGERTLQRVGSNQDLKVDVRVVAATNRNLKERVAAGQFRDDLYFRLKVVQIHMPPLRERRQDIPLLTASFLKEFSRAAHKRITGFSPDALDALHKYSWPGNVRELRTAIESAVTLARGDRIAARDLPDDVLAGVEDLTARSAAGMNLPQDLNLERMERLFLQEALRRSGDNRTEAALALGISRRTLHRKIKTYQLESE
jgi:DNA-binding NtrC family response regulator